MTNLTCDTLILTDDDLDEKALVYYDSSASRLVVRLKSGVQLGLGPHSIGLVWNGTAFVQDIEMALNGQTFPVPRPTSPGAHSETKAIVAINTLTVNDSGGTARARLRWLPVSRQAAAGRNYKVDVVELYVLDALTGIVLTSGANELDDDHDPIEMPAGAVYYPFV